VCVFQLTEAACPFSFGTIFCALFYVPVYFIFAFSSVIFCFYFLVGDGGGEYSRDPWVHLDMELMRISAVACAAFNYHHQTDFSMKPKSIVRTCGR
jgi:hypothetical protein